MADTGANDEYPTVLGADARFKGELEFEKGVRLLGTFDGSIKSKGRLHVAPGAKLNAEVNAADVQVEGEVRGNLTASGRAHLKSTARLEGDLKTARLEVSEGAVFIGRCEVGPQDGAKGHVLSPPPAAGAQPRSEPAQKKGTAQPVGAGK
jgi:cytoskeletal protein CcmA (bactofilin family)